MKSVHKSALVACLFLVASACSTGNDRAPNIDPRTGKHPTAWAVANVGGNHPSAYLAGPSACFECHGKDLDGGISKVSCFSASRSGIACHPGGPSGHPDGWAAADVHGAAAKAVSSGIRGFAHCQICHGSDFLGGMAKKSCLNTDGCHGAGVLAAHARTPWRDVGNTGARTHASSDVSNAAACAVCHANGANSSRTPSPAPPAGTAPGCFNNTLCHGMEGHAAGWNAPGAHGAAAKAAAGGITISGVNNPVSSFGACVSCHGTDYDGGAAGQSCLNTAGCHGAAVAAPHAPRPWRSTSGGATHTSTDTENAEQCAVCHTAGANSTRVPRAGERAGLTGCFNNTMCHGVEGHVAGWSAAAQHGAAAKGVPSVTTGFSACQLCHGSTFNNGTPPACMNILGCHGLFISSPHPAKPWSSTLAGASTHTTTDPGNAATCSICHTAGANSTVAPPNPTTGVAGCFNNTLCHFHQIPYAPPLVAATVHGGIAKQDLRVCQSCHGVSGSTKFDGLALSSGVTTIACSSCHTFAKAHPTDWQGSGTFSHRTAGNIANACILCHDVTQGRTAPLPAAPSCFSASFTNGLGQARTCHSGGAGVAPHALPYNNHNSTARTNSAYCLGCHQVAADVTTLGGKLIPRCLTCHLSDPIVTSSGCTSCHANPPAGTSYPDIAASHGPHANANKLALMTLACADCHTGLGLGTVDHQVRAKARTATGRGNPVVFGSGALLVAGGGTASSFNDTTGQCANVYCHGAKMPGGDNTGTNLSPVWGTIILPATLTTTGCGTCHGFPPTTVSGHPAVAIPAGFPGTATIGATCSCHANINSAGNSYANIFVNKALHINGLLEVSGAHSVPYLVHNVAASSSCLSGSGGCHNLGTSASPYPAAASTAPDCMACHTLADPLAAGNGLGNCRSCHGTGGTGTAAAPTGVSWPNIRGSNNNARHPSHEGSTCGDCHPGVDATGRTVTNAAGSGSGLNHGPNKNRLSGNTQTNSTQTVTGIIPNAARGTGSTCSHSSLPNNACHSGPGTQTWTAP